MPFYHAAPSTHSSVRRICRRYRLPYRGTTVWSLRLPFPGWWPLVTFIRCNPPRDPKYSARVAAKGSTSFIMHMAVLCSSVVVGCVVAGSVHAFGRSGPISNPANKNHLQRLSENSGRILSCTYLSALRGCIYRPLIWVQRLICLPAVQRDLGSLLRLCLGVFPH